MNVKVHLDRDDVDALQGGALMCLLYERRDFFLSEYTFMLAAC